MSLDKRWNGYFIYLLLLLTLSPVLKSQVCMVLGQPYSPGQNQRELRTSPFFLPPREKVWSQTSLEGKAAWGYVIFAWCIDWQWESPSVTTYQAIAFLFDGWACAAGVLDSYPQVFSLLGYQSNNYMYLECTHLHITVAGSSKKPHYLFDTIIMQSS